ncbi:MAG: hypothetical protein M0R30_01345 [Methanoregula sp.]|jgi:hypothetical protein|uniref:hypothetical protein n=1 Tax=Methanoregula sp. TaxID=2052170 RepID=UPI0025E4BD09|nr:hypothetical protein [Methanoregula sp.]MCK9630260.1 hypothetical protein [Methanoregula sp.]
MTIAVSYPDKYSVEEAFQLLKIPWVWYEEGCHYDVVIAHKADVPGYDGPLIDLTDNDFLKKNSDLLNAGQQHLHEPVCDLLLDKIREELKKYVILVEIPPVPWGYPYMVALTHDVDVTSVRDCRLVTVGYAAFQCILHGSVYAGLRLGLSRFGIGSDSWALFDRWKTFEDQLGVRSTFFFVPKKDDPGVRAHPYRAVGYDLNMDVLRDLTQGGWEAGVHGIDNWTDSQRGKQEMAPISPCGKIPGNRTHWLLFDQNSWKALDEAGYLYDTTFGYNDDAGFRAGTLQVYRPRTAQKLLELPLHIQDLGLFGKFCWATTGNEWVKTPCLHLDAPAALTYCDRIFGFARKYGGAVTLLWHYENLTPPRDWSGTYAELVNRAQADGAWVTTAGSVVGWFEVRRKTGIGYEMNNKLITIRICNPDSGHQPPMRVRVHIDPAMVSSVNAEHKPGNGYLDIECTWPEITVALK